MPKWAGLTRFAIPTINPLVDTFYIKFMKLKYA